MPVKARAYWGADVLFALLSLQPWTHSTIYPKILVYYSETSGNHRNDTEDIMRYDELYEKLKKAAREGTLEQAVKEAEQDREDARLADVILRPHGSAPVVASGLCRCESDAARESACEIGAIRRDGKGNLVINNSCVGCGDCITACERGALSARKDLVPVLEAMRSKKTPVFALIAPAFSGQFSEKVTSGRLRSAFKCLGFYGMIEVALFADVLTLKEALEFDRSIHTDSDFVLTSCCCPMWVALIKKSYSELIPHVPPSVSPMVACGRAVKKLHPGAMTVFIGPCLAKKAEAREPDIADAIDAVLTFDEVAELFRLAEVDPETLPEELSDQSSRAGRIYAKTTGVSEAVRTTLERLRPGRKIPLRAIQADGIVACKEMLRDLTEHGAKANFIEGMGCKGGCVGGPKSLLPVPEATGHVNDYAAQAQYRTPADNPHVLSSLARLGFDTVESLLNDDTIFVRKFAPPAPKKEA